MPATVNVLTPRGPKENGVPPPSERALVDDFIGQGSRSHQVRQRFRFDLFSRLLRKARLLSSAPQGTSNRAHAGKLKAALIQSLWAPLFVVRQGHPPRWQSAVDIVAWHEAEQVLGKLKD
jgi:hypothetical protein